MKKYKAFRTNDISYNTQVPVGIPGSITRPDNANVEPGMLIAVSGVFAQAYGLAMCAVAGGFSQFTAANVAADIQGILVRSVPSIGGPASDTSLGGGVPYPAQVQNILVKGYINVLCTVGTPVRDGAVYICNNVSGGAIGDFQATSSANNLLVPNLVWAADGKDASNNAEVRLYR